MLPAFDFQPKSRVIFGENSFQHLGTAAKELGFRRTLLVADQGMIAVGYVEEACQRLREEDIQVFPFHDFGENPDSAMVEVGRSFAAPHQVDSIIGLGGGSSLDCAKGINFVLTNGGEMRDYWGFGKAARTMLPMIGVPTTAGTGSEAQCYALISEAATHVKMACGDPKATFRVVILDPRLTVSQPLAVTAVTGYDALSHAIESHVAVKRNPLSTVFSRQAFRLLAENFERVLTHPHDLEARAAMQLGAYFAGVAVENSMLGAAHACANPLTARYGTAHGRALAMLLPSVVRWNGSVAAEGYRDLLNSAHTIAADGSPAEVLARHLEEFARRGALETRLAAANIPREDLPILAEQAAEQWTGRFNPRPFDARGALEVYKWAF